MKFEIDNALTRAESVEALASRWDMPCESETVSISQARGRVLAEDCHARHALPPYRVSSFDGVAVRASDFVDGIPDTSTWERGVQYAPADTGDDFPDCFDAIVAVEKITYDDQGGIHFDESLKVERGSAVKSAGATFQQGDVLYERGTVLGPAEMALLAAGGYADVSVLKKLRVGFIPTGTELIQVGVEPGRGQNIESNGIMVRAFVEEWGGEATVYGIVPDDPAALALAIEDALAENDIVLINGGSSRGSEDYNSQLLKSKASYFSHGVKTVPGRPIGLAVIDGKPAINVPGPMIAAWLACDWLVQGLVRRYYGQPMPRRAKVTVTLDAPLKSRPGCEYLARLVVREIDGSLHAGPVPRGTSLAENIRSVNALLVVQPGVVLEQGQSAEVEIIGTRDSQLVIFS